jgi:uncharacterized protein YhfF
MEKRASEFWRRFLEKEGLQKELEPYEVFSFTNSKEGANSLLKLVLEGKKRATSSALPAYGSEPIPSVGTLSVVTDWDGNPAAVIKTVKVTIIPFGEMTYEIASREGEDEVLDTWKANHTAAFLADAEECGFDFNDEMPVVFEDFEVVYRE